MYILFPLLLIIMILVAVIFHFRKKQIICKICNMTMQEKICRLDEIIRPFGFCYDVCQDIFSARLDAWQREFGYCRLYDEGAAHFNMVFDCQPVYFDYDGHTWMIEFWKGQYGINIGGETGIYRTEYVIPAHQRRTALFRTVPDAYMPLFSIRLVKGTSLLFHLSRKRHWWLTGFCMGQYSVPDLLRMDVSVTFKDCMMMHAFMEGMLEAGYHKEECNICGTSVSFSFCTPKMPQPWRCHPVVSAWAMWKNRLFLFLYLRTTRPFCHTIDKLLYLYEYLPPAFRHMMHIHSFNHSKNRRKQL